MEVRATFQCAFLLISIFNNFINGYRFEPNTITIKNFTGCKDDEKNTVHFKPNITRLARNKYVVNGEITINQVVPGPFQVFEE